MNPTTKQLNDFLSKCEVKFDRYDMDKCVALLLDDMGGDVAKMDYKTSIATCEPEIYIGEDMYRLSESQMKTILCYLVNENAEDFEVWQETKNDTYDVRSEQGLYGYGY